MAWRVAQSLLKFREQLNARYPNRKKTIDGTIGDQSHQNRNSDHNPWVRDGKTGVVTAFDFTHDPNSGCDAHRLAEHLRIRRDHRVKYVISNARIFSATTAPWTWRKYGGSNPHRSHVHLSVKSSKNHYDDQGVWDLGDRDPPSQPQPPTPEAPRRVLRRGSTGDDVRTVQGLLMVNRDGQFGPVTEAAVRAFQREAGLVADAIVGAQTWAELDHLEQIPLADGTEQDEGEEGS